MIIDVDADFQGSEESYREMAQSKPPRNKPWYHLLVDKSNTMTYVAEQNLEEELRPRPIKNLRLEDYFNSFEEGSYMTYFCWAQLADYSSILEYSAL